MKKILFVLVAIAIVNSFYFIQLPQAKADEVKTFIGKVEKVTPTIGRRPEEPRCKILVVADNGEKSLFFCTEKFPCH